MCSSEVAERVNIEGVRNDIDVNKEYTREEIKQIVASIIIEDFIPKNKMYIKYVFNKVTAYKKRW